MTEGAIASLSWASVAERLAPARNYWLATVGRDGSPHLSPVWGVVVERTFHLYSERSTVKAANLARDPRATVHLESAEDVVIVHGLLEDAGRPVDTPAVVAALDAKYDRADDRQYLPSVDGDFDVLYRLRPERALVWRMSDYAGTQGRWAR